MTAQPKPQGRERDRDYLGAVKLLRCCAASLSPCWGVTEADHAGQRPVGRKADDTTAIPLCTKHHRERTDHAGPFRAWTRETMRTWLDARIADTRAVIAHVRAAEECPWI